ncbi:hypothetical protein [Halomonas huangheensis]|uniref:HNH endonuclease 5 domain-containing protein n=1 Tax=Halomonas huangheensis TaxID=1178482 RepID=W1NAK2_9GAMM|nr:hypothetical protein [Halomonas huangheensis]ERL51945.1 hypothetical protein BJB45_12320 [Halomonas huangheensis]
MDQISNFGDLRTLKYCAFCGGETGTRDHCPSRVFLDQPFPENLPVVPACVECNSSFSKDEEYLACLISCVLAGTTDPDRVGREKVAKILRRKHALRSKLESSITVIEGNIIFEPEHDRVKAVLTKLAQGHALFELHESVAREPDDISVFPLLSLTEQQRIDFDQPVTAEVWPEIGSRAMQRMLTGQDMDPTGWIVVQPNMYRYAASAVGYIEVRIIINEYVGCVAQWE